MAIEKQKCICGKPVHLGPCAGGGGSEEKKGEDKASEADAKNAPDYQNAEKKTSSTEISKFWPNKANIPALSFASYLKGTDLAVAFGITDTTAAKSIDTNTVFQAASLSKPVSAAIVLDLIAQNKWDLDLNTALADIVPDYGPPELQQDTANYKKLTIGMVLGQHSGLPNFFWLDKVGKKFIATPGEHFTYSGEAFDFLKRVIEKKTGRKWEEIAQDFFAKAGMTNSTFKQLSVIANRAVAKVHIAGAEGTLVPFTTETPLDAPEVPAGSLRSTPKDYISFLRYCFTNKFLKSTLLTGTGDYPFNPKVPLETSIGADHFQWSLGMGIYTEPTTNKTIAFHWGNNTGTRTFCAMDTETGDCVACFSNSENGPGVFQQIARPIVGDVQPLFQWLAASGFKDAAPQAPDSIAELIHFIQDRTLDAQGKTTSPLTTAKSSEVRPEQSSIVIPKDGAADPKGRTTPMPRVAATHKTTTPYWDSIRKPMQSQPGFMAPTISSEAKKREKFSPAPQQTIPKATCENVKSLRLA